VEGSEDFLVGAEHVWKVFGGDGGRAREMASEGASRDEIQTALGSVVAVRDVSFTVAEGESFVVMGLSGSGKSTLIRCLARLIEPSHGRITLGGDNLLEMSDDDLLQVRRQRLSMVFQHFGLFPHRTVIDNVAYGLEVQGVPKPDRRQRALDQLESVGLDGWGDHYPQQLSGGMQQRVGLARALAVDPEVLFFDEPFSALDPLIRRAMQDELIELQGRERRTIVFITHDFDEALRLADRIAIMKDGGFEQVGTAAEILTHPATPYVEAFTRDAPKAKILTVASALALAEAEHQDNAEAVTAAADAGAGARPGARATRVTIEASLTLEQALPALLASSEPLQVVDEAGLPTGTLRHSDVAELLATQ